MGSLILEIGCPIDKVNTNNFQLLITGIDEPTFTGNDQKDDATWLLYVRRHEILNKDDISLVGILSNAGN